MSEELVLEINEAVPLCEKNKDCVIRKRKGLPHMIVNKQDIANLPSYLKNNHLVKHACNEAILNIKCSGIIIFFKK